MTHRRVLTGITIKDLSGTTRYLVDNAGNSWSPEADAVHNTEIKRLRGQVAALRAAVTTAERVFGDYARHHRAKDGPDAYGKFLANATLRGAMTAALATTAPEGEE